MIFARSMIRSQVVTGGGSDRQGSPATSMTRELLSCALASTRIGLFVTSTTPSRRALSTMRCSSERASVLGRLFEHLHHIDDEGTPQQGGPIQALTHPRGWNYVLRGRRVGRMRVTAPHCEFCNPLPLCAAPLPGEQRPPPHRPHALPLRGSRDPAPTHRTLDQLMAEVGGVHGHAADSEKAGSS